MRDELKNLDYHVYGLSELDFDYFFDVVRRLEDAHRSRTEESIAPLRTDPEAIEVVADASYYAWVDTVYLWEYALWRMQGIFEAVIATAFLSEHASKPAHLGGLRARLKALRAAGYSISPQDEGELLNWAALRNALSHSPTEPYRPVRLTESDLREYRGLVVRLCAEWREESRRRQDGRRDVVSL